MRIAFAGIVTGSDLERVTTARRSLSLLDGMRQLVCHQIEVLGAGRLTKHDVLPDGIGVRLERGSRLRCVDAAVNADSTKTVVEMRLHQRPHGSLERRGWRVQSEVNRVRCRQIAVSGRVLFSLHRCAPVPRASRSFH